ncbi:MAG: hypothetical protein MZW92_16195 [Comamonadaceae bacterium]|nr:hypothetical protein [Comamonadaceae bacterium]
MGPHFDQFYPEPAGRRQPPRHPARLQPLHPVRAVRARQPRGGRQERVRAVAGRGIETHLIVNSRSAAAWPTPTSRSATSAAQRLPGRRDPAEAAAASRCPIGERQLRRAADQRPGAGGRAAHAGSRHGCTDTAQAARSPPPRWPAASAATCPFSTSTSGCSSCCEHIEFDRSPLTDIKHGAATATSASSRAACATPRTCTCCASSARTARRWWPSAPAPSTAACRRSATTSTCATACSEVYLHRARAWPNGSIPNDPELPLPLNKVHPIHEVVKVDYFLPGCPPSADAIWKFLTDLLAGRTPRLGHGLMHYD